MWFGAIDACASTPRCVWFGAVYACVPSPGCMWFDSIHFCALMALLPATIALPEWWSNMVEKRNSSHPGFNHKSTIENLPSFTPHKPQSRDPWLATFDAPKQVEVGLDARLQSLCEERHLEGALDVLTYMNELGILPSKEACHLLLKACKKQNALSQAKRVHTHLVQHGLESISSLGEYLVATFVSCGDLENALRVFYRLPHRTAFSWAAAISGYTESGKGEGALKLYECMQDRNVEPNGHAFVSLFRACGDLQNMEKGKEIHADAWRKGFDANVFVGSALLTMYGKCGNIVEAEDVFGRLFQHDVVLWNAMLSAYVEQGEGEKASQLYKKLQEKGMSPNERTFVVAIQAYCLLIEKEDVAQEGQSTKSMSLERGWALHSDVLRKGFDTNVYVCSALLGMYGKFGCIMEVENIFGGLSWLETVPWNVMLSTYIDQGQGEKVLQTFRQMQKEEVSQNEASFVIALQACCLIADKGKAVLVIGQALHADARRKGFDFDVFVGSTLVSMYGKCGRIVEAECVFDVFSQHDTVLWTVMLSMYVELGYGDKTLQLYKQMLDEGVSPNNWTFVSTFQACCMLAEKEEAVIVDGQQIKAISLAIGSALHIDAQRKGFHLDLHVGSNLLTMYGKCGRIMEAELVFGELLQPNVVSWNAMLSAYIEQGHEQKALRLFTQMLEEGSCLDATTFLCVLQACSRTGSMEVCRHAHFTILSAGHDSSLLLSTTFIHVYGSCANMIDAQSVFDGLPMPDVVSWNALISGYAREGNCDASLESFEKMQMGNIQPNGVTFLLLLSVFCHAGLLDKGVEYFESMSRDYGLTPEVDHYVSVEDLLGRAGDLTRVVDMLSGMPMQCHSVS